MREREGEVQRDTYSESTWVRILTSLRPLGLLGSVSSLGPGPLIHPMEVEMDAQRVAMLQTHGPDPSIIPPAHVLVFCFVVTVSLAVQV